MDVFDDLSQWVSFDEFNEDVPHCDLYEEFITTNVPYPREIDVAPNVEDSEDEILDEDEDLLREVSKKMMKLTSRLVKGLMQSLMKLIRIWLQRLMKLSDNLV